MRWKAWRTEVGSDPTCHDLPAVPLQLPRHTRWCDRHWPPHAGDRKLPRVVGLGDHQNTTAHDVREHGRAGFGVAQRDRSHFWLRRVDVGREVPIGQRVDDSAVLQLREVNVLKGGHDGAEDRLADLGPLAHADAGANVPVLEDRPFPVATSTYSCPFVNETTVTVPVRTGNTGVSLAAEMSTPKWKLNVPAPVIRPFSLGGASKIVRGSPKLPRIGCGLSNGFTGHWYAPEDAEARGVGVTLIAKNAPRSEATTRSRVRVRSPPRYVRLGLGHGPTVGRSPNRSVTAH